MKKIYLLLSLSMLFMYSCQDVNDEFDWLNDLTKPQNVKAYEYVIADADYATIASAAKGTENEDAAKFLQTAKIFSDAAPADKLVPYLLAKKYYTADVGSSAKITYQYQGPRDELVTGLTASEDNSLYLLEDTDYQLVWGTPHATALTPAKSPEKQLPILLTNKYEDSEAVNAGAYKFIEYSYSNEEPVAVVVEGDNIYTQDFNSIELKDKDPIAIEGWINVDLKGDRKWQFRTRVSDGQTISQVDVGSNGSNSANENWLILPVDLTNATNPYLTFKIVTAYYRQSGLTIKASADFSGKESDIKNATWKDIQGFDIPETPESGYSPQQSAGFGSLVEYKGAKAYIAFVYEGDGTANKTTTYQVDDIKITEAEVGKEVESKVTKYAAYYKNSDTKGDWAPATSVQVLQTEDYQFLALNKDIITKDQAVVKLPVYLSEKHPTLTDGERVIVYKDSENTFRADRVACLGARQWEVQNFIETKVEQFMLSTIGWVFDPTFVVTMVKGKGATDDYMLVVQEVIDTKLESTPTIVNSYKDTEYYYGFNANYGNITYRDKDRVYDPSYPASASDAEKRAFCEQRTLEGFAIYLRKKFPDAAAEVNGVEQKARITTTLYYGPASSNTEDFTYEFLCLGNNEWKYLQRTSLVTGEVEKAVE